MLVVKICFSLPQDSTRKTEQTCEDGISAKTSQYMNKHTNKLGTKGEKKADQECTLGSNPLILARSHSISSLLLPIPCHLHFSDYTLFCSFNFCLLQSPLRHPDQSSDNKKTALNYSSLHFFTRALRYVSCIRCSHFSQLHSLFKECISILIDWFCFIKIPSFVFLL